MSGKFRSESSEKIFAHIASNILSQMLNIFDNMNGPIVMAQESGTKETNKSIDSGMINSHTYLMKTAISIPDYIFEEVNKLALEKNTSRSQIFCIAVEEYLKRIKASKLLEILNSVYSAEVTPEEELLHTKTIEYYDNKVLEKNIP